ncbi:MAG: GDSL-type esterase/lipase family protein, partial [Gammaproteobacteria bacterium]
GKNMNTNLNIRCLVICIVLIGIVSCNNSPELPRLGNDAVILTFGDSLTRGKGAKEDESYPVILEKLTGRKVINSGISGELSEEGLKRFPGVIEKHSPDIIILCHGGNDILQKRDLGKMADNVRAMIQIATNKGLPVILLGVPRPGLFLSSAKEYIEIAETTSVFFIEDLIAEVLGDKTLKSDVAHPNGEGYRKIAETINAKLKTIKAI